MTVQEIENLSTEELIEKAEKIQLSISNNIDLCHPIESLLKKISPYKKELQRRGYSIDIRTNKVSPIEVKNFRHYFKNVKIVTDISGLNINKDTIVVKTNFNNKMEIKEYKDLWQLFEKMYYDCNKVLNNALPTLSKWEILYNLENAGINNQLAEKMFREYFVNKIEEGYEDGYLSINAYNKYISKEYQDKISSYLTSVGIYREKFEYMRVGYSHVSICPHDEEQEKMIKEGKKTHGSTTITDYMLQKFGNEGWEMCGCKCDGTWSSYYFKRKLY